MKEARLAPNTLASGAVWDIAFSRDAQQRYLYVADGSNMKVHVVDRAVARADLTSFGDGGRLARPVPRRVTASRPTRRATSTRSKALKGSACRSSCSRASAR